jgi:hypothetical protein
VAPARAAREDLVGPIRIRSGGGAGPARARPASTACHEPGSGAPPRQRASPRPSLTRSGQPPDVTAELEAVAQSGDAAVVRVELHRDGKHAFTDFLFLYRTADWWQIIAGICERQPDRLGPSPATTGHRGCGARTPVYSRADERRAPDPVAAAETGGDVMAKGQVKKEKTNKPKLSPKEKKAAKAKKKAAKAGM